MRFTFAVILSLLAALTFLGGIAAGLWVTFYFCIYGGIVQIIQGCQAAPVVAADVAMGIIRILASGLSGWLTFLLGGLMAAGLAALVAWLCRK